MELRESAGDQAFRQEVRSFLEAELPKDIALSDRVGVSTADKDQLKRWQRTLYNKGWVAPNWPKEHGGTGWTPTQKHIWNEECARVNAPRLMAFGLTMVGPVIYTFGNDEQKKQHLDAILSGDVWWCQGYSEPGSGSDLASLKTKAERDGDDYIVNGQKIWTSYAHEADWIFCLVRTDDSGKKQEGITFLLIDMKTPGIEVKPIISIDGLHHLNEVFFTDVRVPVTNRIGEEGKGWTYAKFLLQNERTGIAGVPESKKTIERIKTIANIEADGRGAKLWDDAGFREKLAAVEAKLAALEYTSLRILDDAARGNSPGPATSILKVAGTEVQQALAEIAVEAIGYYASPDHSAALSGLVNDPSPGPDYAMPIVARYCFGRASTIYGGTNEIQRDVVAKAVLGL